MKNLKIRLVAMNFLEFAVWGAYLTSMGGYLGSVGMGENIGWFYSIQGIVSIFMPALMGIVADRWVQAQRLLGFCHLVAAALMAYVGYRASQLGSAVMFADIFPAYALSVAFYMPTLGLTNSVSYTALESEGLDTVKAFPPIRIFGTIGFIVSMWIVDIIGWQHTPGQFFACAAWGVLLSIYSLSLPKCPVGAKSERRSVAQMLGLDAFSLFRSKQMLLFFIFSMLLGVSLQITNGYANPFISSFADLDVYRESFFAQHANLLISLSQVSETLCILLIPFFLGRFGIKRVMLMAMFAWVLRFGFFAIGSPAWPGIMALVASMVVYGVAFDFFNVSGSLYVDQQVPASMRSSAQGLLLLMTNGLGATIGTLSAQFVVNHFVYSAEPSTVMLGWQVSWALFAAYALVIAVAFMLVFREAKRVE